MKNILFLFTLVIIGLSSCTVTQEFAFNEDLSGQQTFTFDGSELMSSMGDMTDESSSGGLGGSMMKDSNMLQSLKTLNELEGISNVTFEEDSINGILSIKYDFANIDALNRALAGNDFMAALNPDTSEEDDLESGMRFYQKKKKLTFTHAKMSTEEKKEILEGGMGEAGGLINFKTILTFKGGVKKLKTKSEATLSEDKETISHSFTLLELLSEGFEQDMTISLD